MAPDPRLIPGNFVQARACKVTNNKECSRRYGPNYANVMVCGVVQHIISERNPHTGRLQNSIYVEFDFGDNYFKIKPMSIRMLTHVPAMIPPLASDAMQIDALIEAEEQLVTEMENQLLDNGDDNTDVNTTMESIENEDSVTDNNTTTLNGVVDNNNHPENVPEQPPVGNVEATPRRQNITLPTRNSSGRPVHTSTVVASPNNQHWYYEPQSTLMDVNGPVRYREWGVRLSTGEMLHTGSNTDERYSRLDIFLLMFPPRALDLIFMATNEQLDLRNKRRTSRQEILKFFGVIILATKVEFKSRQSLWSTTPPSKYEDAPNFGSKTGMSRTRFDDLWQCIRFSYQPLEREADVSSENYRWKLVDGFVERFNEHRAASFFPSDYICVDESISRWYGQGGDWINHGLPMYVAIDRKPENGCEIQNAACGRSGVMLQLRLVKTQREELSLEEQNQAREREGVLHGTKVLKQLIDPWAQTDRLVCADSYFSSVGAVEELALMRYKFIGVVKTATRRYPMDYLSGLVFRNRGERYGVVSKDADNHVNMMAFVWMDRERRYFIASAGSLAEGEPYIRHRWRQVSDEPDAEPERVELTVPQPRAAEMYYKTCAKIDQHNRDRQSTLGIERKLVTSSWSLRVNLSIFSMICVDTWKVYSKLTFENEREGSGESQKEFYGRLAAELIDNRYDNIGRTSARRQANDPDGPTDTFEESPVIDRKTGQVRSGEGAHLTPTRRRQVSQDGIEKPYALQGRCKVCIKGRTTYECSVCRDNAVANPWICNTKKGKKCFAMHLAEVHP